MQSILGNTRKSDIAFFANGRIDITAYVAKLLNLHKGDVIDVMCDNGEYLLFVKHKNTIGRHEGMVYRTNKKGKHLRAYSSKLCNTMLKECNTSFKVKLCVGEVVNIPMVGNALPIITKNIIL